MPRKSTRTASGGSPEKPTATSRRNTRRGQKASDEVESEVIDEIPAHLLKASDESSEHSDNDSDYGSPKKGRGRGRGRGKKVKETPVQEEKPATRPRRGRRAAQSPAADHSQEESVHSQTTNDENDASTMESEPPVEEKEKSPEPAEKEAEVISKDEDQPENDVVAEQTVSETVNVEPQNDEVAVESSPKQAEPTSSEEKVSEEIEQDLQPNNDQAPVNEEVAQDDQNNVNESLTTENNEADSSNKQDDNAEVDDKPQELSADDEISKDAPELTNEDDSRSNSSEPERQTQDVDVEQKGRRSRSSSGEIHEDSVEKMEVDTSVEIENKKSQSPVKSITRVDRRSPIRIADDKPQTSGGLQRKRKWGARKTDDEPVIAITTDSLKNVIAEEVKPVDVKLASSPSPEPEEKRPRVKLTSEDRDVKKKLLKERLRKQEEEEDRRNEQIAKAMERSQVSPTIIVTNGAGKERKVSVISAEDASPPTPPKNQISRVICITNLVRPLTFMAVKSLVARTGEIEDFWIDAIKSKCFVEYKTEDEAVETRHALHGVKWPEHNLKTLHVEFSTKEEMNKTIEATRGERISNDASGSRETKQEKGFGWSKQDVSSDDRSRNSRRVREWDVGKKEETERDEDRENRRRRRSSEQREKVVKRRSVSKSPARDEQKEITPIPQHRCLDDLFKKTKALPFIYWMPLSEERIKELEEQRLKNIAEHKRREEEMMKIQKERREARELRMREDEKRRQERRERDQRRSRSHSKNARRRSRDRSSRDRDRNRRYDRR